MDFTDEQLERYARHIILKDVGGAGQLALMRAKVLVVGAGGLGSPLLSYLAAAGVGTIGIVDDDEVDLSNLQRQIIHATNDIGEAKSESAAASIAALNSDVKVVQHNLRLDAENVADIIGNYDIVADGTDNFKTRHIVNDTCVALKKTLVSAALGPFEGQIGTFKPHAGEGLPCYRCFLPEEPPEDMQRTCSDIGILGAVAGVVGTLQATEVLKEILGIGDSLAGKMLFYDALTASTRTIKLPQDPKCPVCATGGHHG
ncbi:MAG: molybdopterin-synthase adenylyltransferase MoeB [Kordiimonadaceae bacterium]|nr:molybdopterin-synthase adenylyltransferase MoeB [Kordiimonadaceae bacterium]MBO6568763.1 molybdopterin-synthase adenylyltransferase MoeB [Kordiimonadaceae bacterium]MBO6965261.1 molybdopterin-synthase adenylyltransferase MoeB [Kordiimonadaceae bacterium]